MKRQALRWSLVIFALAIILVGCAVPSATPASEATPATIVLTDDRGAEVELAAPAQRIVSLAPSHTEILFALGVGDKVVGVTNFCDYPEEAKEKEKVGDTMSMNVELIASLTPDLVIAVEGLSEVVVKLEDLDIPVLVLQPTDLDSIYATIETIGKATGSDAAAATLVSSMRERIDAITEKVQQVEERPRVFYELDATDPAKPFTPGPGTWHDQFIEIAGGENIADDAAGAWVQFSTEEIIARDPDMIILGDANYGVTAEDVAARPGWDILKAVQNGAIYPIDDNLVSRPGPRVVEGVEALAHILHPEFFD